ncbi:MAG: SpoIIE family protein phosphatase [Calditrichia bacterium]|nr:SpoIIE family protein phosphatase [Calditrichia bacterium]
MTDHLASFKERKNLEDTNSDDMDRRLIELSALFEISQTLNSSLNLQSILNNVLLVPMGRMMLGKGLILIKNEGNIFRIETIKGLPHKLQGKEIEIPNLPTHSFFINELEKEESWITFFKEFKIELMIPIISRTDVIGLLGFSRKITGQSFSENEIEFLGSLTNIATTSIENALVFDQIQKVNRQLDHKIQELNTLFDIGKELNLTLDKDKILKLLSYALMGQVTVNSFIIALKEGDNFRTAMVKGSQFSLKEGDLCEHLCELSGFLNTPHLRNNQSEFDDELSDAQVRVVVPMQIQNETQGYIFLGDKITKQPYIESDLEFLQTLGNVAIISLENARLFIETLEKQKLEEEMALAWNIQARLLPKTMPDLSNILIHGVNIPSKQVGGDYFDIINIDSNCLGITIADVSGKGMGAALLMSNLQASLQSLVKENYSLDKLVGRINNVIYQNTDPEKYITFFYGQLDKKTLTFDYVNAGHNPPYLLHKDGTMDELITGGIILGMMPDMPYEIGACQLKKGDMLMLYTDGVTETMTLEDEEYEETRLINFLKRTGLSKKPEEINNDLILELEQFASGAPQNDDITILTLQVIE